MTKNDIEQWRLGFPESSFAREALDYLIGRIVRVEEERDRSQRELREIVGRIDVIAYETTGPHGPMTVDQNLDAIEKRLYRLISPGPSCPVVGCSVAGEHDHGASDPGSAA